MLPTPKLVYSLACVVLVLNFCMMVSMFHVAGKAYVAEEGYGTERLFRIDYGTSFQGIITCFTMYFVFYCHHSAYKAPSTEKVTMLMAATVMAIIMLLQTGVLWGNEVQDMLQVTSHKQLHQECSYSEFLSNPDDCIQACSGTVGGACQPEGLNGFSGYIHVYTPDLSLKPGAEAACTFAVLQFLIEVGIVFVMFKNKAELVAADYTMGSGSEAQQVSGDTYQKL